MPAQFNGNEEKVLRYICRLVEQGKNTVRWEKVVEDNGLSPEEGNGIRLRFRLLRISLGPLTSTGEEMFSQPTPLEYRSQLDHREPVNHLESWKKKLLSRRWGSGLVLLFILVTAAGGLKWIWELISQDGRDASSTKSKSSGRDSSSSQIR